MARQRTAVTNPPSTGYRRPTERKFWVWRDRGPGIDASTAERWGRETHLWRWCCTLCEPPSHGSRTRKGAWAAIVTVSMPRHFRVRHYHHDWAARKPRTLLLPLAHTCVLWLLAVGGTVATARERTPPVTYQPAQDQLDAMTDVTAARAQFDHWVRAHLAPENATLAERVADLLGPVALPALDTLVRGAYSDGTERRLLGRQGREEHMMTVDWATDETEKLIRAELREKLHYPVITVPAAQRRDGEFAYVITAPRQVPNVLRAAARWCSGYHVQRVHYVRPGTVHVYLKAGPDGWQ